MEFKTFSQLRQHFRGQWREVLWHFGIELPPTNRHSPCPICGGGKDRFRFEDKGVGRWFCQYHTPPHGDGMDLIAQVKGWDNSELIKQLNALAGYHQPLPAANMATLPDIPPEQTPEERRAEFDRHYQLIRDHVTRGPCQYLKSKGYSPMEVWQLTQNVTLTMSNGKKMWFRSGGTLLKLTDASGRMVGLQCIYEAPDGFQKRMVPGSEKKGAFHAMTDLLPGRPFVITEGFATGFALRDFIPEANVVVAVDAGNLVNVAVTLRECYPDARITVAADNDADKAGLLGALKVRQQFEDTLISMPVTVGEDWDDVLRCKGDVPARKEFSAQLVALKQVRLPVIPS